jgi:hypothetical protein
MNCLRGVAVRQICVDATVDRYLFLKGGYGVNMNRLSGARGPMWVLAVVAVFGALTGSVYAFLLPAFFPGYKTQWILISGVLTASLFGGYIGFRSADGGGLPGKIGVTFAFAALTALLVTFLSLFIVLNIRGG